MTVRPKIIVIGRICLSYLSCVNLRKLSRSSYNP